MKILLVDDDLVAVRGLRILLESCKHRVLFADGGIKAFEVYRTTPEIDLILTDLQMPEGDGLFLTQGVILHNPKARIWIQTGMAPEDFAATKTRGLELGAEKFISKLDTLRILEEEKIIG